MYWFIVLVLVALIARAVADFAVWGRHRNASSEKAAGDGWDAVDYSAASTPESMFHEINKERGMLG